MRFVQYKKKNYEKIRLGVSTDDGSQIKDLSSFSCYPNDLKKLIECEVDLDEIRKKITELDSISSNDVILLPPIMAPQKILCVGLNYKGHCDEQKKDYPKQPMFFSKYASTLVGACDNVVAHKISKVNNLIIMNCINIDMFC